MQAETQGKVDKLVHELKTLFEDRLVSVCVYGSAVFQEALPPVEAKHKDINVLIILKGLELSDLEKASSIGKWWEQVGHSLPMFLSEAEWQRSSDVFSLEYADIRDNHVVAYGKDLYNEVSVNCDALRLVCELELHRKLIYLRQRMLIHRDKPEILLDLLQHSVNSFAALFRGVLRLKSDVAVPQKAPEVFEALKGVVDNYDPEPFLQVIASKAPKAKVSKTDIFPLYHRVIGQVSLVTAYVDDVYGFVPQKEGVPS